MKLNKTDWLVVFVIAAIFVLLSGAFYMGIRELDIEERKVQCICEGKVKILEVER